MSYHLAINGQQVISGTVTIPLFGAWSADLSLALATAVANPCNLQLGNLSLKGTVIRQVSEAGSRSARIVGGAGGWRNVLPPRGYSQTSGLKLSLVLSDAARESGETLVLNQDQNVGTQYVRIEGQAQRVLDQFLEGWWIDPKGITQTGPRNVSPILSPFTLETWSGARGEYTVATEAYEDWTPGRTFSNSVLPIPQTISSVSLTATNEGSVRLTVLADATQERLLYSIRQLIQLQTASLDYAHVWEYTIVSGTSSTVDVTPTDLRMPALTNVPMMPGLMGETVTPVPGGLCRIVFVNGDPTRPECVGIQGSPLLVRIEGPFTGPTPAPPGNVARVGDTAGPFVIQTGSLKVSIG